MASDDHAESLDDALNHACKVASSHEREPFDYEAWQQHAVDPRTPDG